MHTFWLSDYLLWFLQTNDTQLSTMVAEQVRLNIYYELPNILIWILLLISLSCARITVSCSSPSHTFMSSCWMINSLCEYFKIAGWASSCWYQCSCGITRNNKQSTWELHRYWQVSLLSWFSCFAYARDRPRSLGYMFSFISALFIIHDCRLCQECQTLIENHDRIKLLSNARNNLNTTLKVCWVPTLI